MTDLSILDELEEIGIKTISMIQIIGDKVQAVQREVYISQNVEYTCFTFDPEEAHTELSDQDRSYNYTYHYKYPHPISFKDQFYEQFRDKIASMGESYFFIETGGKGHEFTIQGPLSGILRLKKEIQEKFPLARIIEL